MSSDRFETARELLRQLQHQIDCDHHPSDTVVVRRSTLQAALHRLAELVAAAAAAESPLVARGVSPESIRDEAERVRHAGAWMTAGFLEQEARALEDAAADVRFERLRAVVSRDGGGFNAIDVVLERLREACDQ